MDDINTEKLYDTNKDFRNYVEKYIFKHHVTLEEALKHIAVLEYALYLKEENQNEEGSVPGTTSTTIACGC